MKLEDIGFYTLSDERARTADETTRLLRCELIVTGRCNFRCPYCRRVGGENLPVVSALETVRLWAQGGLRAIRFSGGEPLLYPWLDTLVNVSRGLGITDIAVSSNGSFPLSRYEDLLSAGVNDFSISLDACCAADSGLMDGLGYAWETVVENIRSLALQTYLTVGIVLTETNAPKIGDIIRFADGLGVSDIRVIPAAQHGVRLPDIEVDPMILGKYPILRYRVENLNSGYPVRGLDSTGSHRCGLALDDMAVMGGKHYPCIIYLREGGAPIGDVGPGMRQERKAWYASHDTHCDPICKANCLDVCALYNRKHEEFRRPRA